MSETNKKLPELQNESPVVVNIKVTDHFNRASTDSRWDVTRSPVNHSPSPLSRRAWSLSDIEDKKTLSDEKPEAVIKPKPA